LYRTRDNGKIWARKGSSVVYTKKIEKLEAESPQN
jgi:hypothetical protein